MFWTGALATIVFVGCLTGRISGEQHELQCPVCHKVKLKSLIPSWKPNVPDCYKPDSTEIEPCPKESGTTPLCSFYEGNVTIGPLMTWMVYSRTCYQAEEAYADGCYDSATLRDIDKMVKGLFNSVGKDANKIDAGIKYTGNICLNSSNPFPERLTPTERSTPAERSTAAERFTFFPAWFTNILPELSSSTDRSTSPDKERSYDVNRSSAGSIVERRYLTGVPQLVVVAVVQFFLR